MRTGVYPVSSVDDTFVWLGVKENDEPPFRMCVCVFRIKSMHAA